MGSGPSVGPSPSQALSIVQMSSSFLSCRVHSMMLSRFSLTKSLHSSRYASSRIPQISSRMDSATLRQCNLSRPLPPSYKLHKSQHPVPLHSFPMPVKKISLPSIWKPFQKVTTVFNSIQQKLAVHFNGICLFIFQ